ncbi:MAG: DUF5009 domain-containing protein [candidate division KSB1 bacterium]|nr:DUF5009 domain-containing protein [candidate division KSB1 bacterium]
MSAAESSPIPGRLQSLDAFRGFTIAAMMLVNNPGSWQHVLPPLLHAEWNGWTFTDLIFPFFLFIVGTALVFSFTRRLEQGAPRRSLYGRMFRRTLLLILFGLFLNAFPKFDFEHLRYPGVLQRIGLCYLMASLVVLHLGIRGQAIVAAALLVLYWLLMKLVPVPGYGPGVLSPEGNLGAYIDRLVFGQHMFWPNWDPEGLLSTIPAVSTTLLGVLTGHWLRTRRDPREIAGWMFVWGNVALVAGSLMNFWFPINKNLWSPSYTVYTAGVALNMLAAFYWLIDVKGYRSWSKPFVVWGMNAIAVYVFIGILARIMIFTEVDSGGETLSIKGYLWKTVFSTLGEPWFGSLLHALVYVAISYLFVWCLWRRRIFLRL